MIYCQIVVQNCVHLFHVKLAFIMNFYAYYALVYYIVHHHSNTLLLNAVIIQRPLCSKILFDSEHHVI